MTAGTAYATFKLCVSAGALDQTLSTKEAAFLAQPCNATTSLHLILSAFDSCQKFLMKCALSWSGESHCPKAVWDSLFEELKVEVGGAITTVWGGTIIGK